MHESDIERYLTTVVGNCEGEALKVAVVARRGFPDRLVLLPVAPEHRALVARYVAFVELKRPARQLDPLQYRWAHRLGDLGFAAHAIDSRAKSDALLARMRAPDVCTWVYTHDEDIFRTDCDHLFSLIDGRPSDNGMRFCPYCGRTLIEGAL